MHPGILTEQDGRVLRITVNRPDRGNAFTDDMIDELTGLVETAGGRASLVVLAGAGADFCAGRDAAPAPADPLARRRWADNVFRCYGALREAEVPVVAVVRGRAHGFGCAIAAASTITLAADDASFQVPEMAHRIMPGNVLSALMDRVPRKALAWLILTSAAIGARDALACGLASALAPAGRLDALVQDTCERILACPDAAVRGVQEFLRAAPDMPMRSAVDYARSLHAAVNSSAEVKAR